MRPGRKLVRLGRKRAPPSDKRPRAWWNASHEHYQHLRRSPGGDLPGRAALLRHRRLRRAPLDHRRPLRRVRRPGIRPCRAADWRALLLRSPRTRARREAQGGRSAVPGRNGKPDGERLTRGPISPTLATPVRPGPYLRIPVHDRGRSILSPLIPVLLVRSLLVSRPGPVFDVASR